MTILANTLMTATRNRTNTAAFTKYLNPFRVLRAQQALNKFRSLDDELLHDIGMTRTEARKATLAFFMNQPQR